MRLYDFPIWWMCLKLSGKRQLDLLLRIQVINITCSFKILGNSKLLTISNLSSIKWCDQHLFLSHLAAVIFSQVNIVSAQQVVLFHDEYQITFRDLKRYHCFLLLFLSKIPEVSNYWKMVCFSRVPRLNFFGLFSITLLCNHHFARQTFTRVCVEFKPSANFFSIDVRIFRNHFIWIRYSPPAENCFDNVSCNPLL